MTHQEALLEALRRMYYTPIVGEIENALRPVVDSHADLVSALERMLGVQEMLMPGLRHIAVPDYQELNEAPLAARAALAKAEGLWRE